ncbi:TPA: hypothetical protein BOS_13078 [Bos taurus]|nr:TPA: hypothetical protein BOS_13078 [Bos taurus]
MASAQQSLDFSPGLSVPCEPTLYRTTGSTAGGERKQRHTAENPSSTSGNPIQQEIQVPPASTWIDDQTSLSLSCLICKMETDGPVAGEDGQKLADREEPQLSQHMKSLGWGVYTIISVSTPPPPITPTPTIITVTTTSTFTIIIYYALTSPLFIFLLPPHFSHKQRPFLSRPTARTLHFRRKQALNRFSSF